MYRLLLIKRFIEDIFILPFILAGRLAALRHPLKKEYKVFFFFPFYHTGGAEKVHAQIVAATGGTDCIVFFTKRSVDDRFLEDFKKTGCDIRDISKFTDDKWLYFLNLFYRGMVTGYINAQVNKPIVFNGQCNFAYKISRWIKRSVPQIELIHSLNSFSYIRIPFLPFITKTIMISKKRIDDHKELYRRYHIPASFEQRIQYIPNAIDLPQQPSSKSDNNLTVLYVGRGTEEKRVHLVHKIGRKVIGEVSDIDFEVMGEVNMPLEPNHNSFTKLYGNVKDETIINQIYARADVLILTSSTEGFPMVIMEAMAHGCVIISTAVGDIPYHVKNGENGFLFSNTNDEASIINEGTERITWLKSNRDEMNRMAANNIEYARNNFGIERFNNDYRELFLSVKSGS